MGKIIVLDKETAGRIAAGEVVTDPAAVVKELVENALDAGARRIKVEIADGGKTSIRVVDDGEGMAGEDVPVAFRRYATSKIKDSEDLGRLSTFGFRGEALPSIAAVSRLTLVTRRPGDTAGTRVVMEGGEQKEIAAAGCPSGTDIEVADLFFNTPARQKFLKSNLAEGAKVGDIVTQLALGNAGVAFVLIHNGREVLRTAGKGLLGALAAVYGQEAARAMIPFQACDGEMEISGFFGDPLVISRAGRQYQSFFLNARYIKSKSIAQSVEKALHGRLMIGRYPVAVVNINIPPAMADVNIHPAKHTVRLYPEKEVLDLLQKAVCDAALGQTPWKTPDYFQEAIVKTKPQANVCAEPRAVWPEAGEEIAAAGPVLEAKKVAFPQLTILGQVESTYIVCVSEGRLFLVDQHAAHERVLYERLSGHCGNIPRQTLLVPETIELAPADADAVVENIFAFAETGFELEHFGGNTFLLRAVPADIKGGQGGKLFLDILEALREERLEKNLPWRERLAIVTACRSAVKAGDRLDVLLMEAILNSLASCHNPWNCPHGRPTIVHISSVELEKKFKRVL